MSKCRYVRKSKGVYIRKYKCKCVCTPLWRKQNEFWIADHLSCPNCKKNARKHPDGAFFQLCFPNICWLPTFPWPFDTVRKVKLEHETQITRLLICKYEQCINVNMEITVQTNKHNYDQCLCLPACLSVCVWGLVLMWFRCIRSSVCLYVWLCLRV